MSKNKISSLSLHPSAFLPDLKKLVVELSEDLLTRSTLPEIDRGLREAYAQIEKGGRTADAFEVWREDYLDQVAVAWVLACVFVRFMEDNGLIDECWLAGEGAASSSGTNRRKLAEDTHELYFRAHPHDSDREYFEHVFYEVGKIPACRDLFAEGKTPLWAVGPSGDMAMKLLGFWRDVVPETGELQRSFEVEDGDTRFLGDLYQDLSERARKKYALLQTPVFVEEFILDRTLDPAIDEFGLDEVRMIDPTCGSGHFLLGSFARLFDLWIKREDNEVVAAQKALDGVWGCDINPFAVAIARFRLIVAALRACGIKRLTDAPAWNIHLATGDSLLFGAKPSFDSTRAPIQRQLNLFDVPDIYAVENPAALNSVLGQGYHAVVGNPPYITVKDRLQNEAYRSLYSSCSGKYSLGVPFTQRFWELALQTNEKGTHEAGYVGMITSNSFMKREFGKKLIEEYLPKVDLRCIIDTSRATIPGHGTPTIMLFGRNQKPISESIRAVLGIKDEQPSEENPANGLVWQSIVALVDRVGTENEYVSTCDLIRSTLASHPWSIGGGGVTALAEHLADVAQSSVVEIADAVGVGIVTLEDDAYVRPGDWFERHSISTEFSRPFIDGGAIREWHIDDSGRALFPYSADLNPILPDDYLNLLWPYRTNLENRLWFRKTQIERGLEWYEYGHFSRSKYRTDLAIACSDRSSHNHFALSMTQSLFNQGAPVITLPEDANTELWYAILGLMNSSACLFWLRLRCFAATAWRVTLEKWDECLKIHGKAIESMPVPHRLGEISEIAKRIHETRAVVNELSERVSIDERDSARTRVEAGVRQMVALQEELDWATYAAFDLASSTASELNSVPSIECGQRAFEIVMARQMVTGELETTWFERHGSQPITEIPAHWPEEYRNLVERRIELIETNKEIGLIEKPEYKRRWSTESWQDQQQRALKHWLLDRLEGQHYWPDPEQHETRLQSVAELSDKASGDHEFLQVAAIFRGREDFDVAALVVELIEAESVPFLPILRYKPAGLRKREVWEKTWELQRKEDAGENVGEIKVPPKYASADFQSSDYWRLRGKLDVPKERWISFPHCETESDPSLVVGWAGWNHLQQATALIAYYDARKREGWDAKRLTPLLAGLDQLLPWIHQWHGEVDPEFGETAGQSFETMLKADAHELGLTLDDIRAWEPPKKTKTRRKRKTK